MNEKTMADVITSRRKTLGMTQKELAEKMHLTDKAVSKWERGLACPDTASIPRLAEILGITVEELMTAKPVQQPGHKGAGYLTDLVLKTIPLAMGVAVAVTAILGELDVRHGFFLLGLGLACLGLRQLKEG